MIGRVQAALALAAALGLHIGAFALHPGPAGAVASGAGGAALVSLAASDGALADLVAAWDRPPEPSPAVAPLGLPATPETAPDPMAAMQAEAPPRLPAFPELAALPPASPAPRAEPPPDMPPSPQPSAEAPAPPPPADIRPKARPKPATRTEAQPEAPRHKNPPAPAQAGQLARGTGDGAAAGQGGRASAGTASAAAAASAKAEWGARIRSRIERRKAYPPTARGAAGTVTVRLSVDPGGGLLSVNLAKSSGNDALDAAALRAVRAAAPFPAAPRGLGAKAQSFTLPMTFRR
jgi:protein TonB